MAIETTISDLRIEPATNGVIISYQKKTQKSNGNKNTYDNCTYDYPKEVFDFEDGSDDPEGSALDKAFSRFKTLWMEQYKEYKKKQPQRY